MCATGLRHAPTVRGELSQISRGPSRTEARAQDAETIADTLEHLRVRGFRHPTFELIGAPRRDALRRMRKCPKPTIFTSSPFSKQRKMMSNTDSTTEDDCRFESPWLATALTRSFFVTVGNHLPLGTRRDAPGRPRRSLPASRDEGRVAPLLQLAEGRRRGRLVVERPDAHAIHGAVAHRGRGAARRGRRGRRAAGGATDLHLEAVDREILRESHRVAQRHARPYDD